MKIIKTASGKRKIKLSRKEWQDIGRKAGWMKVAKDDKKKSVKCPKCGKEIWDVSTVDQALNKCWNCGMRFLND